MTAAPSPPKHAGPVQPGPCSDALDRAHAGNACSGFSPEQWSELTGVAAQYLATDRQFMRMMNQAGSMAQAMVDRLPAMVRTTGGHAAQWALERAYTLADASQPAVQSAGWVARLRAVRGDRAHRIGAMLSGGVGGFFGMAGTLADLPVTTTLILRSVQQIAQEHGFDPKDPAVRADCLTVFGMGGPSADDDQLDSGLWAVRVGMARMLTPDRLAGIMASEAFRQIVQRFGVVVSQKLVTQAAPVLGAVVGASINPIFTRYYQAMAHVHFRLRRLEAGTDPDQVRACFEAVVRALRTERGDVAADDPLAP